MALTKISTGMLKQDAASSDLNIDAGTLYLDVSNNRVGIANTSPSQALDVTGNVVISGTATATTFVGSGASLTSIPNSALTNSSITINSTATSLGGSITLGTDDVAEGSTNLYYTNARADARIAAASTDDLSEGSSNLYYTDSRVGTYISGNRTFGNITTTGYIRGPSSFTIDPAAHGDNSGTVVIAGNLQVDGTTTTINSTTMTVDDLNLTLASGAANAAAANGAGITVDGASATITYDGTNDEWDFNKSLNVSGAITSTGVITASSIVSNHQLATTQFTNNVLKSSKANEQGAFIRMAVSTAANPTYAWEDDTNTGMYRASADALAFSTGGTQALTLDSSQNATFAGPIVINGSGTEDRYLKFALDGRGSAFTGENAAFIFCGQGGSGDFLAGGLYLQSRSATAGREIGFITGTTPTKRMVIDSSGNVGIGTSVPNQNGGTGTFTWPNTLQTIAGTRPTLFLNGSSVLATIRMWPRATDGTSTSVDDWHINAINEGSGGYLSFAPQGGGLAPKGLHIKNNGNVGVGVVNPGHTLDVQGAAADGTAVANLKATSVTGGAFQWSTSYHAPALAAGQNFVNIIGKDLTTAECGYIGYHHIGTNSAQNSLILGMHSADYKIIAEWNGSVAINSTTSYFSPSAYNNDAAGISSNLVIKDNGHAGIILISGASSDGAIAFGDGTGAQAYRGAVAYVHSTDRLYFKANALNRMILSGSSDQTQPALIVGDGTHGYGNLVVTSDDTSYDGGITITAQSTTGGAGGYGALFWKQGGYATANTKWFIGFSNSTSGGSAYDDLILGSYNLNSGYNRAGRTDGVMHFDRSNGDIHAAKQVRQHGAQGFKARNSTGVSKAANAWENIGDSILTVEYNKGGWNSSTGRFQPTVEGYYLFTFGGWALANSDGNRYATCFSKNGALTFITGGDYCNVDSPMNGHSEVIYMNGSSDYVDLKAYSSVTTTWGGTSHAVWWGADFLH